MQWQKSSHTIKKKKERNLMKSPSLLRGIVLQAKPDCTFYTKKPLPSKEPDGAWILLTCRSENFPWNCSAQIHAERPEVSSPCLHCGWTTKKGRVPDPRFWHCHSHSHSSATPPRSLWNSQRFPYKQVSMISIITHLQKYVTTPNFDKQNENIHRQWRIPSN